MAAIYDISLGIADRLPEHGSYMALIGVFLFVIGVAYALIFVGDLQRNRDLITVGALYKLAYCSVAFYYFAIGDVPHTVFISLFGVADLVFLVTMTECRIYLSKMESEKLGHPIVAST